MSQSRSTRSPHLYWWLSAFSWSIGRGRCRQEGPPNQIAIAEAVITTANLIEASYSDIEKIPAPSEDIAALAERRLIKLLSLKTGAKVSLEPITLQGSERDFDWSDSGRAALVQAAKTAGVGGVAVNVRAYKWGVRGSGTQFGTVNENYFFFYELRAALVDLNSGEELARAECSSSVMLGTYPQIKSDSESMKLVRENSLKIREEMAVERRKVDPSLRTSELLAEMEEKTPLPPAHAIDNAGRNDLYSCVHTLGQTLLNPSES